jgi:hypothetical protein
MHQVVETYTYTHVHSEAPSNTDREEVQVHGCNKLASRHVRLELAESRAVPRCDICENAPAFFFCGIDGTSLCLHCDTDVHIGGKKTHERYLLTGQRVEARLFLSSYFTVVSNEESCTLTGFEELPLCRAGIL